MESENQEKNNNGESVPKLKHRRKHKLKHKHKHQLTEEGAPTTETVEASDADLRNLIENKIAELEITSATQETECFDPEDLCHENRSETVNVNKVVQDIARNNEDPETQFEELKKVYLEQSDYVATLETKVSLAGKKCAELKKRHEAAMNDLAKSSALQEKLQQLCRGLQRQNKTIIADSKRMAEEEHAKRHELSEKFHKTIEEVSVKLNEQGAECVAQLHENESLREKLKNLIQQYETREEQYEHQLKARDLKAQLAEAKLNHQIELTAQERAKSELLTAQAAELMRKETELQSQLGVYAEKFEVFQETLNKSNSVFASFKAETDRMSACIKKLEKENKALRIKCEKYDLGAIAAISEKKKNEHEMEVKLEKYQKQLTQLQGICRTLQKERDHYRHCEQELEKYKNTMKDKDTNSHDIVLPTSDETQINIVSEK